MMTLLIMFGALASFGFITLLGLVMYQIGYKQRLMHPRYRWLMRLGAYLLMPAAFGTTIGIAFWHACREFYNTFWYGIFAGYDHTDD